MLTHNLAKLPRQFKAQPIQLYMYCLFIFLRVQITKWKHALKVGLIADVAGMGMGIILSLIFLH